MRSCHQGIERQPTIGPTAVHTIARACMTCAIRAYTNRRPMAVHGRRRRAAGITR